MTLAAAVAGIASVGSGMLVVGMLGVSILVVGMSVFSGGTNLSINFRANPRTDMRTIVRAGLSGMSVSLRRLLVWSAKRHHYRVQILQRQAANQH